MQAVISAIGTALGAIMGLCYSVVKNYGLTIIIFTLISKVILMPVSIWVHRNGLKVIRMQPEINRLHIKHFGDKDAIAEGQAALYKREKYNPLASLVPLAIQIIILMGVIEVIYHPLNYLLHLQPDCINAYLTAGGQLFDFDPAANQAQLRLLRAIGQGGGAQLLAAVDPAWQGAYAALEGFNIHFLGVDLTWIASEMGFVYLLIPIVTGASSLFLSLMQNKLNPLQHEQNAGTQWGTLAFSVGLSLYLGYFVPAGVALYWIASNLSAILVQLVLNWMIDPRKHVDYQALEETRAVLETLIKEKRSSSVKNSAPTVQSSLRHQILKTPKAVYEASGIVVNGRRIKSLLFTTDLAIIRNCDADAIFAVYPFTPQQAISEALIKAAYVPVFCGVGGGTTKGVRTVGLAKDAEGQGAMGVVLNAPISNHNLRAVSAAVDIPVVITVVNEDTSIAHRLESGAAIINVAGGIETPTIVRKIRAEYPDIPIIATGGGSDESIRATILAGANAITITPPSSKDLFQVMMSKYREM